VIVMAKTKVVKDVFVDSCVAVRLENPVDPEFLEFLLWLSKNGSPVITKKILKEYYDSLGRGASNFMVILDACQRDGRFFEISNDDLKSLRFTKKQESGLLSNRKDWWHIKAVLLSPRKLAISFDNNFVNDLNSFPRFNAKAAAKPSELSFK